MTGPSKSKAVYEMERAMHRVGELDPTGDLIEASARRILNGLRDEPDTTTSNNSASDDDTDDDEEADEDKMPSANVKTLRHAGPAESSQIPKATSAPTSTGGRKGTNVEASATLGKRGSLAQATPSKASDDEGETPTKKQRSSESGVRSKPRSPRVVRPSIVKGTLKGRTARTTSKSNPIVIPQDTDDEHDV